MQNDTIAAIATAPGRGGVGIVRLSGPEARSFVERLFRSSRPDFTTLKPYRLHHGHVYDLSGACIDEVMAAFMPGPGSYTGEDVVEISCHGSPLVVRTLLDAVLSAGARPATAGEFTKRAFMNGKMDLSQAEAVIELIDAESTTGIQTALAGLQGRMGEVVASLRSRLEHLRMAVCLAVDFPEEDVECLPLEEFDESIAQVMAEIEDLIENYQRSAPWREGVLAVLTGRVNAGKSSLLNAILGRSRAIVTDIPGTTRDFLEERIDLGGLPVNLVDTAGLRETDDVVERLGLDRSLDLLKQADLVLVVIDASASTLDEVELVLDDVMGRVAADTALVVLNKSDIAEEIDRFQRFVLSRGVQWVCVSAKTGEGLPDFLDTMRTRLVGHVPRPGRDAPTPNTREKNALMRALEELAGLRKDIAAQTPYDLLGVRLETAQSRLSEITGEMASEDVINAVFERFCIGK
ncbi:tRNA uridine-5-carboxymethylaminomethyl(34) synthesis GTPase MnmE [Desulfovibrio inopinatus]|uniref:tRNA uridine-5-carboxymethylaminomethyl(34) synthesis GTPase MnmE n=1 Tax=Desulfovibrio inopinatus TaxID=102109 RepID=UPI0003F88B09|nr:tRNA uridine-5-carboxymethylaminomethyl(34) synthesis GTPase MnmE [Desulfovibrio inopinatus]